MSLGIRVKFISFIWWLFAPILMALLFNSLVVLLFDKNHTKYLNINDSGFKYLRDIPIFLHSSEIVDNMVTSTKKLSWKLDNIQLKACYVGDKQQFIILQEGSKILFLNLSDSYKNAKLKKIGMDYAIFSRDNKNIRINLEKTKTAQLNGTKRETTKDKASNNKYIDIKRNSFKRYKKSIKQALRDIRVEPLRKGREFLGIRISFIRRNSLFDSMGFKKGDIIKSIDGHMLTSFMDLLPYYNRLDETTTIVVGFERDNNIKEITYEIN